MRNPLLAMAFVFALIPFPVYSFDGCLGFYENRSNQRTAQRELISSKDYEVTVQNRIGKAAQIWGELISYLTTNPNASPEVLNSLMSIKEIIEFAVENTIQHGSVRTAEGDYSSANALNIRFDLVKYQDSLGLVISNPQIKPFPKSLEGEFFDGDSISVNDSERTGYQGHGLAHVGMQLALENLPPGSSLKWLSNGKTVTFELKIKTQSK